MSDLNCELMGKFKVFLLGVPLALGVLAGCSEEVEYEMPIYDFVNPSVCFFVSDAATGVNLLDPDEPEVFGRAATRGDGGRKPEGGGGGRRCGPGDAGHDAAAAGAAARRGE